MQEIGRLLFTRKDGESFVVGTGTTVTLNRRAKEMSAKVTILRDGEVSTHTLKNRQPLQIEENVHMELCMDHGRGTGIRVLVVAPKDIKVLRSELIGRGPK